jgi:hypothetical protein
MYYRSSANLVQLRVTENPAGRVVGDVAENEWMEKNIEKKREKWNYDNVLHVFANCFCYKENETTKHTPIPAEDLNGVQGHLKKKSCFVYLSIFGVCWRIQILG